MSRQPGRRYFAHGEPRIQREFPRWGRIPDGYDVYIEIRDLRSERDGNFIWPDGHHKVVITGPQPRPRSKAFQGETAWSAAERYAGDVVAQLQRQERDRQDRSFLDDHIKVVHIKEI